MSSMSGGLRSESYRGAKAASQARENEEKKLEERRKGAIVLILDHLLNHGYTDTFERLQSEAKVSLNEFDVADNLDLLTVIQDYESYFEIRFRKQPKLFRRAVGSADSRRPMRRQVSTPRLESAGGSRKVSSARPPTRDKRVRSRQMGSSASTSDLNALEKGNGGSGGATPRGSTPGANSGGDDSQDGYLGLKVTAAPKQSRIPPIGDRRGSDSSPAGAATGNDEFFDYRLLKPLPLESFSSEQRDLANTISRDIFTNNPNVRWGDIAGLEDAKRILKEAVVMPVKYPELFTGILAPWKGLLLFGPPGTGKTMLAKAVATECKTTFFNISASSIVSKWRGDSEKLVRMLFELARHHAPSTIFLDEIDALMGQRGSGGGAGAEHEGSRRMKTELLIQMDGLSKSDDLVFVLCASNLPWELDIAMLRRLEKRILVPLPNKDARSLMFARHLDEKRAPNVDYDLLAECTEGYSGSDIHLVSKEAAMRPLRRLMSSLEENEEDPPFEELVLGPVLGEDIQSALEVTRPSANNAADLYVKWMEEFGST